MKRLLLMMVLCLLACSSATAGDEALFPIRVDGKWGYMNKAGEVVIAPQWAEADLFSGGVARVSLGHEQDGLIDRDGNLLVPPEYRITEHQLSFSIWDAQDQAGYYDKASGFFLPPQYDFIYDYGRTPDPILARWYDGDNDLYGYLRRDTGEVAIPFQYDALYDNSWFINGYALATNELVIYDEDGRAIGWSPEFHLIDAQGNETVFPDGIFPDGPVSEGVLRIGRDLTDEERKNKSSGWGTAYGLGTPSGEILVWPQYDYVHDAQDGCVCFWDNGLLGHMDLTGRVIVPAKYNVDLGGPIPEYRFSNGYAVIQDIGSNWPETERWLLLDRAGNEILLPFQEEIEYADCALESGLLWYFQGDFRGLLKIENGQASKLTGPIYEAYQMGYLYGEDLTFPTLEPFAEGLMAVKLGGLWGYINENAEMVIPPAWDAASGFYCGLAQVEKDGKLCYIDTTGAVVWQEP